jgi:hypothetical protein
MLRPDRRRPRPLARWLRGGVCVAWIVAAAISPRAQAFDRRAWQQDYSILKQALERRYSHLAWFGSSSARVHLPALDRRTQAALQAAQNDDDARDAILDFTRAFGDGHLSQLATLESAPIARRPPAADFQYSRQDAAGGCAALRYAPYDLPQFSLPFESLPGFRLMADGIGTPFRAGIMTAGDSRFRVGIVRIASFEETSDQGLCLKAWSRNEVWDEQGRLKRDVLRRIVAQEWYESLARILRALTTDGAAAVLVDVGNNSGGGDSGDIAARLFTRKPLRSASLWMTQDLGASVAYFSEQLNALREAQQRDSTNQTLANAVAAFARGETELTKDGCKMNWVWRERRAWADGTCRRLVAAGSAGGPLDYVAPSSITNTDVARALHWPTMVTALWGSWDGPLYVLTNNRTYSAAEMFAAVLQNNGAAKVVGTFSGGDSCGFMIAPEPVVLPHSQLRFRVPNCVRLRADGTDEVAGIRPDISVLPTEGETSTMRANRVFDELLQGVMRTSDP